MSSRLRRYAALAATLIVMLAASGCTSAGEETSEEGAASAPATVQVSLTEFAISPPMIHAPVGEALAFEVTNEGTAPHTFAVDTGEGVEATPEIQPGESATLRGRAARGGDLRHLLHGLRPPAGRDGRHADGRRGRRDGRHDGAAAAERPARACPPRRCSRVTRRGSPRSPPRPRGRGTSCSAQDRERREGVRPHRDRGQVGDVTWRVRDAMAYNGTIPGPEIRVDQGEHVRIVVHNDMTQPTVVHFHGLTVPNDMDGVPFITQDPILPGGFFVYEFDVVDRPACTCTTRTSTRPNRSARVCTARSSSSPEG